MAPPRQGDPVVVRIPADLLARLDRAAQAAGVTRAEMIRRTIAKGLGK